MAGERPTSSPNGATPDDAPPRVVVVIGDLVASRQVSDRAALQTRFVSAIHRCNTSPGELLSPYTVTLGDEFQTVLSGARHLFADLTTIAAELLGAPDGASHDPLSTHVRFSVAVGRLATPINPTQAIEMDGPAFHSARLGIEQLKRSGDSFLVSGLGETLDELCNALLALVSHEMSRWNSRRHWVLAERMRRTEVSAIADRLGVSSAAVYKNLTHGGVDIVCRNFLAVARMIDSVVDGNSHS